MGASSRGQRFRALRAREQLRRGEGEQGELELEPEDGQGSASRRGGVALLDRDEGTDGFAVPAAPPAPSRRRLGSSDEDSDDDM